MIDPSDVEQEAIDHAGDMAGEVLDAYGADINAWTPEQWETFIATVCGGYVDYLVERRVAVENAVFKVTP